MNLRRRFLQTAAAGTVMAAMRPVFAHNDTPVPSSADSIALPEGTRESAIMEALPGKVPLIKRTFRPPNFETPIEYFAEPITPNDAFFVRYHLSNIPQVDVQTWRLRVAGSAGKLVEFSLDELQREFEQIELTALCLCSGNRRGLHQPHVPGIQWGYGAMGNARWRGVRLKDVLTKVGVAAGDVEVVFDGADSGVVDRTPDYVKSIPVWKAMDENTLIAFSMNGAPLPHWNGYPARLVVPGWTATYWVKHLTRIDVAAKPLEGFWMKPAYRIPKGKFALVDRFLTQETEANTPITEMVVNSLIATPRDGERVLAGSDFRIQGVAWDGGYGIRAVELSTNAGRSWSPADLGPDLGRFSFRSFGVWSHAAGSGRMRIMARAFNKLGSSQTLELINNPAGYHHNVVHGVTVNIV